MKPAAIISQQTHASQPTGDESLLVWPAVLPLENTFFRTIQTGRENKQQSLSNCNLMKYVDLQTVTKDPGIKHPSHALSQHIPKTLVSWPRVHYFNS